MKNIAIIGSGTWGVALAIHLAKAGNNIKMWSFSEEEAKELYDKLVSLLHEKHDDAKYKSPLSGSHIYSCSFQSDKGIISLAVQLHDYEYRVKMTYCDRINYMPVYKKQRQKALDDM